jgi:hypothetical protein
LVTVDGDGENAPISSSAEKIHGALNKAWLTNALAQRLEALLPLSPEPIAERIRKFLTSARLILAFIVMGTAPLSMSFFGHDFGGLCRPFS